MKKNVIVLAGGGTGGHFFCCQATSQIINDDQAKCVFVTDQRCKNLVLHNNLTQNTIFIKAKQPKKSITGIIKLLISILTESIRLVILFYRIKPKLIIGFGGYVSFYPLVAGILLNIPIILNEQNTVTGKVNKIFSKFAKKILFNLEIDTNLKVDKKKIFKIHPPIREKIVRIKKEEDKTQNKFTILIIGGSAAAKSFTSIMQYVMHSLINYVDISSLKIVHQCPLKDVNLLNMYYEKLCISSFTVNNFFYDIEKHYKNADLILARAGSGTITEILSLEKPSILIPLPNSANNHQKTNANYVNKNQLGWCVYQSQDLQNTAKQVTDIVMQCIKQKDIIVTIKNNIKKYNNIPRICIKSCIQEFSK